MQERSFICDFTGEPCRDGACKRGILCISERRSSSFDPPNIHIEDVPVAPIQSYIRRRAKSRLAIFKGNRNPTEAQIVEMEQHPDVLRDSKRDQEEDRQRLKSSMERDLIRRGNADH